MTIDLIDKVKPKNDGNFGIIDDTDMTGGYQVVVDIAARDAIQTGRRKEGMKVLVVSTLIEYRLANDLTTWNEVTEGSLGVATHADLALIVPVILTAGDEYTVNTDGTKWTYTGTEPAAPDPTVEAAWSISGPARDEWFSDPAFPTADSRTLFFDAVAGSNVFNDGSTLQPFYSIKRGLDSIPENSTGIPGATGFGARLTFQYQGGAASKADLTVVDCAFAKTTPMNIVVHGELSPVDLDGIGTTNFAAAVFNRDLTGPVGSGGTVAKKSQYRLGVGVNVLASVQQPANDGDRFIFRERSFGFPGLRFIDGYNNCKVHDDGAVMGAQDIGVAGGQFNFGLSLGDTTILSDFVTQVDASLGFLAYNFQSSRMPRSINLKFVGMDFYTDVVAQGAFNRQIFGNYSFEACKWKVGGTQSSIEHNPNTESTFGRSPFKACTFIGESAANNGSYVRIKGGQVVQGTTLNENLLITAAMILGDGRWTPYMNIFRGAAPALGNNGNGGRLFLGTLTPNTERGEVRSCSASRVSNDIERAPGELTAAATSTVIDNGGAIVALGFATAIDIGGSQGPGTFDVDGRGYRGVFGAEFISQNNWFGEVTRPMILRTGAHVAENQYNSGATATITNLVNSTGDKTIAGGGDVEMGTLPAGSIQTPIVLDWADLPATDIAHGDESEGIFWR